MRRVIILDPCLGSGYLTKGKIYDVKEIRLYVYNAQTEDSDEIDYETATEEQKDKGHIYITIVDDIDEDEILDEYNADKYILFENDKDLAHYLIDNVEGLDSTLINMKKLLC